MESLNVFWTAWPWVCLGGAAVLFCVSFATRWFYSREGSRWRDPVWLAWLLPPILMLHMFEEYGLHITNGQFDFVTIMASMPFLPDLPAAHFPLLNMLFAWVALPIAAHIARKNLVIGLSGYGFILVNGLVHLVQGIACIATGGDIFGSLGFFTGTFIFIPLNIWVWYVVAKERLMGGKGIAVSLIAGILGHICLFFATGILGRVGAAAILLGDAFVCFAPIVFAWLGCKLFKVPSAGDTG